MAESRTVPGGRPWALLSPDGSYHKLQEPTFFVGRHEDVHLTLKSRSVDKEHAVITAQPDQGVYYIHDLESLNGTFVNEKRVQRAVLGLKDTIRFGYDMNTFRVDLLPCQEPNVHDDNDYSPGGMRRTSGDYLQDTDTNSILLTSNKCCKGLNESSNSSSEQIMSRLCHNCGSKTANTERLNAIVKGSKLYGQPSWWGWESSDEEFYTYPNCASVITQAGTLAIPLQHNSVLQKRIQRNKAKLEHSSNSRSGTATSNGILAKAPDLDEDIELLKEDSRSMYPRLGPFSSTELQQLNQPGFNVPAFGAWETVPQRRFDDGPGEFDFDGDEKLSYDIPFMPDFGEIPEKPVSEKSSKTARRKSNKKPFTPDLASSSSFASETSHHDNGRSQPTPDYTGRVFDLTEVNMSRNEVQRSERWPTGVKVGKPRTSPVQVKTTGPKPSTPRSVTDTNKTRSIRGAATPATSEYMTTPTKPTRGVTRTPSSGGSSAPSDTESRDSEPSQTRNVFTSTSDDSEGENEGRATSSDDKGSSAEKRNKKFGSSLRDKGKDLGEFSDKTHRPSPTFSGLPRANKTAMLRALNSREAVKNSAHSATGRPHCRKPRHRHSTPTAILSKDHSPIDSNSSLRIWSPSVKKPPSATSPSGKMKPRPYSVGSTPRSSRQSSQLSSDYESRVAVDAIFDSSTKTTYALPKELQMNRNDAKNKTFVLEEKNDSSTPTTLGTETTTDRPLIPREGTIDLLRPKKLDKGEASESLPSFEDSRPFSRPSQPPISLWMSLPEKGRSASPESIVSVPPATSPSPPSTPRSSAQHLLQDRLNCCSAPLHSRRQWDVTDKPVEDLMLSSVHAFTVELRLASESVLSKARNLYEFVSDETAESTKGDKLRSNGKSENQSTMPEWKSSHAEIAGVFRNLRRVEFNLRTMDQALSFLCSASGKEACKNQSQSSLSENPQSWKDFKVRARAFSWAEENRNKFPTGPPSGDEEVSSP